MKTSHTPGPVKAPQRAFTGEIITSVDEHGLQQAEVVGGSPEDRSQILICRPRGLTVEQAQANARLIASAPSLLAALELALATLERVAPHHSHGPFCTVQGSIDQALAAIASAKPQSLT